MAILLPITRENMPASNSELVKGTPEGSIIGQTILIPSFSDSGTPSLAKLRSERHPNWWHQYHLRDDSVFSSGELWRILRPYHGFLPESLLPEEIKQYAQKTSRDELLMKGDLVWKSYQDLYSREGLLPAYSGALSQLEALEERVAVVTPQGDRQIFCVPFEERKPPRRRWVPEYFMPS